MIKTFKHIKFCLLIIAFLASIFYALTSIRCFIYNNEFSKSLTLKSLKLDSSKVYFFTTTYKSLYTIDTILLPIENKSFPDSLCYLYFDNEWKLKLTDKLRNNDLDKESNIFYPWCCTQDDNPTFFSGGSIVNELKLKNKGIKFNYFSGISSDRLTININKIEINYFLKTNLLFLGTSYPISNRKENIFELDFCNYGDTIKEKYIFSVPIFNAKGQPDRKILKIDNENISWQDSTLKISSESQIFNINSLQFEVKENYSKKTKQNLLFLLVFIPFVSLYMLYRLFKLLYRLPHRNLLEIEQSNILILRIVFNCIILVGFPILILKVKYSPERLYWYSILVVMLNINWIWLFNKFGQSQFGKILLARFHKALKPISKTTISTLLLAIIIFAILLIWKKSNNEKLFGIFPILHVTKFLYILLPFILTNKYVIGLGNLSIFKKLNVNFSYILVGILSFVIALVSSDYATFLFTILAILFIQILERENVKFIWKSINSIGFWIFIGISSSIIYIYRESIFSLSKVYRFTSTTNFPTDNLFKDVEEQSKQTVAQQIYLLKSTMADYSIFPTFKTVLLPSWKSTFFSDYAVLWSFKSGGYFFIALYFLLLVFVSYCIISLLIVLNKKIPLHNGKIVSYDKKVVLTFNILLSIFLIQYIYTFLSNLWLLPVTGQSPGILCPSFFEVGFHLIFINSVYYFIDKKRIDPIPNKYPLTYSKIRKKSIRLIFIVFIISLFLLLQQLYRINFLNSKMSWEIDNNENNNAQLPTNIESDALAAYKKNDKVLFKLLHQRFYNMQNLESDSFRVSTNSIIRNTNIDSVTNFSQHLIQSGTDSLIAYKKELNSQEVNFISNKLYSGCPVNSTTVNFSLQKQLNIALQNWANKINSTNSGSHIMVGGTILIASNDSGNVICSSSYPMLYNENRYHLHTYEDNINSVIGNYNNSNHQPEHIFRFKYADVEKYINFAEYDQIQGSIVKPLLAYCGLSILPQNDPLIQRKYLENFLGKSQPIPARELFKKMSNMNLVTLKGIYKKDFGIIQFNDLTQNSLRGFNDETYNGYAIGQRNKLIFKEIVQAYTRIKTGKKIKYRYNKIDTVSNEPISLNQEKLATLQNSMKFALTTGTANNVGVALRSNGIKNFSNIFLAKTGTPQIAGNENHNRTSSFIIVTNNYTIGIQLFGDLPNNSGGLTARHLFISIINELKNSKIL